MKRSQPSSSGHNKRPKPPNDINDIIREILNRSSRVNENETNSMHANVPLENPNVIPNVQYTGRVCAHATQERAPERQIPDESFALPNYTSIWTPD